MSVRAAAGPEGPRELAGNIRFEEFPRKGPSARRPPNPCPLNICRLNFALFASFARDIELAFGPKRQLREISFHDSDVFLHG